MKDFEDDANQSIDFGEPINKEFIIKTKPSGEVHDIKKFGEAKESKINPKFIDWIVDVNTKLEHLENASIVDKTPEGLALDFDSIKIHELIVGSKGNITVGELVELSKEEIDSGFKVTLGDTDKAYRVTYRTEIKTFKTEYKNEVSLKESDETKATADFTIEGLEEGSLIEKTGWHNAGTDQVVWQIDVNTIERALKKVQVLDELPGD